MKISLVAAVMLLLTMADAGGAEDFEKRYHAVAESKSSAPESQRLRDLFELDWAYTMSVSPETATYVGFAGHETRWTDNSPGAIAGVVLPVDPLKPGTPSYWLSSSIPCQ